MRKAFLTLSISAGLVSLVSSASAADWLQFGYDAVGSSNNTADRSYSTTGNAFAWPSHSVTLASPGTRSDSTPILVSNVVIDAAHPDQTDDVLLIMSDNGILHALRASSGAELWHAPSSGGSKVNGAPAVSPNDKQYVYAYAQDGKIHKYRVADGHEVKAPEDAHWPQLATNKPNVEKQASGLAIAITPGGDFLYSAMNGYGGDGGDYQGHVTTINLATGNQKVFNTMCSDILDHLVLNGTAGTNDCNLTGGGSHSTGEMSGIWGRPGVVYVADMDRIFFTSGNGVFNANIATSNYLWGDSVLSLHADGSGLAGNAKFPVDSATPKPFVDNYQWPADADLGSTSPAILPSTSASFPHLAVQGGKEGCVRLFNLDDLNGHGPGYADSTVAPELNPATACSQANDAVNGEIRTQPAVWVNPADNVTWFFIATDNGLYSYRLIVGAGGGVSIAKGWTTGNGGTSPVIANGTLYYVSNHGSGTNTVRAVNPLDGTTIWSDSSIGAIHWQSPIVANGRLYIADQSAKVWAYTIDGIFRSKFD
ncbi:MAG TPA: PQQ-binding-like beta-propeller repeat protein [Rudaea sp.]